MYWYGIQWQITHVIETRFFYTSSSAKRLKLDGKSFPVRRKANYSYVKGLLYALLLRIKERDARSKKYFPLHVFSHRVGLKVYFADRWEYTTKDSRCSEERSGGDFSETLDFKNMAALIWPSRNFFQEPINFPRMYYTLLHIWTYKHRDILTLASCAVRWELMKSILVPKKNNARQAAPFVFTCTGCRTQIN